MKRSAPGVLKCMLLLGTIDLALRLFGFARTVGIAKRIARGSSYDNESNALVDATVHRILVATAFYPGCSKCLEQAIAAFILLRRRGFDAQIRMGVQPYPFFAHAWVELDGRAITESPEVIAGLALLPEVAA